MSSHEASVVVGSIPAMDERERERERERDFMTDNKIDRLTM